MENRSSTVPLCDVLTSTKREEREKLMIGPFVARISLGARVQRLGNNTKVQPTVYIHQPVYKDEATQREFEGKLAALVEEYDIQYRPLTPVPYAGDNKQELARNGAENTWFFTQMREALKEKAPHLLQQAEDSIQEGNNNGSIQI